MDSGSEDIRQEAESRVGTTLLGKWHLDALIGVGGMAAVFAATHRNGLRGAVKLLSVPYSRDADVRARFLREGYIANRVDHPGAVHVLDDDTTDEGRAFLVMELLEGCALHVLAERGGGNLEPWQVLCMADQVLDVLAAAHAKEIVHRDIKPENLFLTLDGRFKVLDFGIARITPQWHAGPRETLTGEPMGTPAFMSPEQARGRWDLVGPQSDLYSLGASMFNLLSGEVIHDEATVAEMVSATFTKPARSVATARSGLPKPIARLVDRALLGDQAARWRTARAMQAAVRAAYRESFGVSLPAVVAVPASVVRPRSTEAPRSVYTEFEEPWVPPVRGLRKRPLLAIGPVAALALAFFHLHGVVTAESAGAEPLQPTSVPAGDPAAGPVAPNEEAIVDDDDHALEPQIDLAAPVVAPPPISAELASPSVTHRARRDLKALFDRRH